MSENPGFYVHRNSYRAVERGEEDVKASLCSSNVAAYSETADLEDWRFNKWHGLEGLKSNKATKQ